MSKKGRTFSLRVQRDVFDAELEGAGRDLDFDDIAYPFVEQRLRDYIVKQKLSDDHKGRNTMVAEVFGTLTALLLAVA